MNERPNEDVFDLRGEKNIMRLKAEAAVTGNKFVRVDSDARKIGEESECTLQTCVVGVRLVRAECGLGLGVNIE
jgi:hypothetical protein